MRRAPHSCVAPSRLAFFWFCKQQDAALTLSHSLFFFACSGDGGNNMATPDAKVRALYGRLRDSVSDFTAEQVRGCFGRGRLLAASKLFSSPFAKGR